MVNDSNNKNIKLGRMENIRKSLGLRIKEVRKNKKLTQTQLAEKIGIDYKHLSRIEVGSSYPSINTLEKIAFFSHLT